MNSSAYTLARDCAATLIPQGDALTLKAGTGVVIMQTLGGHITVRSDHGLFRLAREDADALPGFSLSAAVPAPAGEFGEQAVWDVLKTCYDPEIPVNIVDLGLVYDLDIAKSEAGGHRVEVKMTLTAPGCGMGPVIAEDARAKIAALASIESAQVHIVWDPVWTPQMISAQGRQVLGLE